MTIGAEFPTLTKPELFARFAAGHAANVTAVTPNRRLAQELAREFDSAQGAAGLDVWEAADILPVGAFIERLYDDARYSDVSPGLPRLLTGTQEQELWQAAIRSSRWGELLLTVSQAATDCRRAWTLAHEWGIAGVLGNFPGNDDARAFAEWSNDYARRCHRDGNTDGARLPDVVATLLGSEAVHRPALLVVYAFDVVPPQLRDFLDVCARQGIDVCACGPRPRLGEVQRLAFASAREELDAAARWARARLEGGAGRPGDGRSGVGRLGVGRIGVVVPELGPRRKEVARVFARIMRPGHNLPGAESTALPFNISIGVPLSEYPLVHAALSIIELAGSEVGFEQAAKLIRSPFLAGAESGMARRARLEAAMRRVAPARLTLGKLVGLVESDPDLRRLLDALFTRAKAGPSGERSPQDWGRHFSDLLAAAGFPGERGLDSIEFQTRAKFNETLAELAKLEHVVPRMSFTYALARLRRLCADTLFQPETPDAPVQVLGVLESAGLEFDALWVSGLTDDVWPLRARPNPFLPPALQRKAGIPEASPEATLARARRITEGWLVAAGEVIVSHPEMDGDRALITSPLITAIPAGSVQALPGAEYPRYRDRIHAARKAETMADGQAPPLATSTPRGGTRILSDQAACPFRAYARHRLAAESLEEPVEGPDARTRGLLLHALMKELWSELKTSEALQHDCTAAINRAAAIAVTAAGLEEPFAGLERTRLAKLAREWLEVERGRSPFAVVATEDKRKLVVAGLEINGRIDRMDKLESGGHALIDYKTGRPTPNEWLGERPDDPQLPLYALNASEDVAAVAFAKLRTGEMRFMGFSRDKESLPGLKQAKDWSALLAGWKQEIEFLGASFAAGDARVDPKKALATCRYCDLQTLCRVYERVNTLAADEDAADD